MQQWTVERVLSLAPDSGSASAGQSLSSKGKWKSFASSDRAVWGLCQGSGKDPYQTRIDLSEPAFKCSCPSRKFPCKHGIGLMLLFAKEAAAFKKDAEPGWVTDWLSSREERAEKKVERAKAAAEKPVDEEAQAKRAAQREARVGDGIASCKVWLEDLVRRGLAAAQTEDAATWDRMAARMVDAQAPGLAVYVRRLPELIASGAGWDVRALDHLGRLHLLLRAGEGMAGLPAELVTDVRTALGWNQAKEEVLASAGVADRWVSLGQIVEEEDRLKVRRCWLMGRTTGRRALVLDFAAGLSPLGQSVPSAAEFDAELAFYPSAMPLRALVKAQDEPGPVNPNFGTVADATIEAGLARYAHALAANPWVPRWPLVLTKVRLVQDKDAWHLVDSSGAGLPLRPSFSAGLNVWRLLSATGGGPTNVVAEWDGFTALPLSAVDASGFHDLAPRWAA